ncbi:zinc ribbon domain-containing protein [Sulfurospirillum barnesii]|uniref:Zn-ribbon protein, possibly nucleic acid-binding protein n=1 Tax=Sulfurospirillum barnesii (strain ATCC 700032 / DSM 10660 / SES-3) TaxID=760154 RepID=I3XYI4_SULBS|nr:zinc ribbon domain-containing protein [Sulfurospirillum barnesii]AFL69008.1 Zn-ribbon protein, possibly nucleic acid-binding protein [Sulfurospirillum barnesii SES-3]
MNKYLEQLIALSKLDKEIDDFAPRIAKVEKMLKLSLDKERELKLQVETFAADIADAKLKKGKNEAHLAELSAKLKDISKKSALVKTAKEIKALQLEEEISKEQCDFANDEINRLDKIIGLKQTNITTLEEKIAEASSESESIKTSIDSQIQAIEEERKGVYQAKEELLSDMSQKILTFYEKIRKWAGNSTVVPVKKQACYGCFMRINDKTYAGVMKQDDIVTCPHCGRILYKEIEEAKA